jgi:hypothetical protein
MKKTIGKIESIFKNFIDDGDGSAFIALEDDEFIVIDEVNCAVDNTIQRLVIKNIFDFGAEMTYKVYGGEDESKENVFFMPYHLLSEEVLSKVYDFLYDNYVID